jgi:simple sugar transport system permease protein
MAVPYVYAALGGALTERSGVIDLALEAKLLFGAFAAAAVAHATDSAWLGIVGGAAAGMLVAAVQAFCALWLEGDQVIIGVALNLIALSGTRFLLQLMYHEGANSPPCPDFGDAVLTNPLVWGALVGIVAAPFVIRRTRYGLRLRAAGDRPDALLAVGVSPRLTRLRAALAGGVLAGLGGAQLSLSIGGFIADMSGGRGYMALVMIILSGWRPAYAAIACVGVAVAQALGILMQLDHIPSELAQLMPNGMIVLVLAVWKTRKPPEALGKL